MKRMLLIVDPQIDFISGTLPVPGAAEAMAELAEYVAEATGQYAVTVITADWHPYRHCSFKDCGGEWPRHCVADSIGAAVYPHLLEAVFESDTYAVVLHKGTERDREEYSIFRNQTAAAEIARLIEEYCVEEIDICGLAGDICVLSSLRDAMEMFPGVKFGVLTRFSPSLDGGTALSRFIAAKNPTGTGSSVQKP